MTEILNVSVAVVKKLTKSELVLFHYLSHGWNTLKQLEHQMCDGRVIGSNSVTVILGRLSGKLPLDGFKMELTKDYPRQWRIVQTEQVGTPDAGA